MCPPSSPFWPRQASVLARRGAWLHRLTGRLSAQAHDVFTGSPGGLGHHQGSLYAVLEGCGPATADELAARGGGDPAAVGRALRRLHAHGLARPGPGGRTWVAGSRRHRTIAAKALGVHGTLMARARRIGLERAVWEWWRSELDWMHTPARQRPERRQRRRRPGPGQTALPLPGTTARHRHGPYPRTRAGGRADHAAAHAALIGQTGQTGDDTAA